MTISPLEHSSSGLIRAVEAYLANPLYIGISCCSKKHATQHSSQIPFQHKMCLMSPLGLSEVGGGGGGLVE